MNDRWRGNSDVFLMEPFRWPPENVDNAESDINISEPDEPELSPREKYNAGPRTLSDRRRHVQQHCRWG
jgi:hypothetical protein